MLTSELTILRLALLRAMVDRTRSATMVLAMTRSVRFMARDRGRGTASRTTEAAEGAVHIQRNNFFYLFYTG